MNERKDRSGEIEAAERMPAYGFNKQQVPAARVWTLHYSRKRFAIFAAGEL
ncbi:MAG: hypothetical protein ACTHMM_08320 [Agriterribacter sp.]